MKITAHCIVKNEDIWVWYALQSVLPFVEKILVFDTGSTDKTKQMIQNINSAKIIFEEKGLVNKKGLVKLRNEQIDKTKTDWFLVLDGDEIWPESELKKLIKIAQNSARETVGFVNRTRICIGDIFHYLPDSSGRYELLAKKGNYIIRLIKKTPDLKVLGEYPLEAYADQDGPISEQNNKLVFADCWYLHTSFLKRSSSDKSKASGSLGRIKFIEKGIKLEKNELPEVLFRNSSVNFYDIFQKRSSIYELLAFATSPILRLKRFIR